MRKISTLVLLFLFSAMSIVEAQIYVSQLAIAGSNDGTSWANAYLDLADAIVNAQVGDEIWVALGEFTPPPVILTDGTDADTTHAYYIDKDIKLYGGFIGGESSLDQRNTLFNPVILNGDINDDDIVNRFDTLKNDNAHHIFYLTENLTNATVIDGFVIWRGQASSDEMDVTASLGGGIYSAGGSPTINDCRINECFAFNGGGIYIQGEGSNSVAISNCVIDRNAGIAGGGLFATNLTSLSLMSCRVTRTKTSGLGAIVTEDISTVDLEDCVVQNNDSELYSAIYSDAVQNFNISRCLFTENHANFALTMQFEAGSTNDNVTFDQCRIVGNTADTLSAGVGHDEGNLTLINTLLGWNIATGANLFSELGSGGVVTLNHVTIANPKSPIVFAEYGTLNTTNTIFYSEEVAAYQGSAPVLSTGGNICSDQSMNVGLVGTGDLTNTDPLLKDPEAQDFLISFNSPARNAAVNSTVTEDINGDLRDAMPDIGAFENFATATAQTEIIGTSINVYPTVSQDKININWESDMINELEFHVVDQRGAILKAGLINTKHQPIDVSTYAAGQYQIIFTTNNQKTARTFIKM